MSFSILTLFWVFFQEAASTPGEKLGTPPLGPPPHRFFFFALQSIALRPIYAVSRILTRSSSAHAAVWPCVVRTASHTMFSIACVTSLSIYAWGRVDRLWVGQCVCAARLNALPLWIYWFNKLNLCMFSRWISYCLIRCSTLFTRRFVCVLSFEAGAMLLFDIAQIKARSLPFYGIFIIPGTLGRLLLLMCVILKSCVNR